MGPFWTPSEIIKMLVSQPQYLYPTRNFSWINPVLTWRLEKITDKWTLEKITDKLSHHQHIIGICHPVSLPVLNVGAIQSRQEKKIHWVCWSLHNQHDFHPVFRVVQLPEPLRFVLDGWYSTEGWCGTPLVAWLRYAKTCEDLVFSSFNLPWKILKVDTNGGAFSLS